MWGSVVWEAPHLSPKYKTNMCVFVHCSVVEAGRDQGGLPLGPRLGTPGCFLLPVGIGKCILVVGDTVGAMMHAPTACVQGCSRSRGEVVSG